MSYAFTILKLSVFMRGINFDTTLYRIDETIGFGWLRRELIFISHSNDVLLLIADQSYQMIFPIIIMFSVVNYIKNQVEYENFIMALFFVHAIGAILYILIPAWGPFISEDFHLSAPNWFDSEWRTALIQKVIASNSLKVQYGDYVFNNIPAYGFVAAMPSLHVATPAVAFLFSRGNGGPIMWIAFLLLILSAWAAIVTGMHYGIDLVAGFLLAIISTRLGRFCINPVLGEKPQAPAVAMPRLPSLDGQAL